MNIAELPSAVTVLWAKSGEPYGHSLLLHMLDVAAVAEVLLSHEPETTIEWAAKHLEIPTADAVRWLAALVGLHDFGKASPGFQAKWPEGRAEDEKEGFNFPALALARDRHDIATASLLGEYLRAKGLNAALVRDVLQAISAHHGFVYSSDEVRNGKPIGENSCWKNARGQLFAVYWDTMSPKGLPDAEELSLPVVAWLAGLASVCDWIGSNVDWFPMQARGESLFFHYEHAKTCGRKALADIGWPAFSSLLDTPMDTNSLLGKILGKKIAIKARPLQTAADRLLQNSKGPVLMLVEAPMGEGKTELAFLAHLRLQAKNHHRGLYVALPTQATGNAMFDRALGFLRAFAGDRHLDIQLAHGSATLDERVARLRNVWGNDSKEAVTSSAWFTQRRRGLLSSYGIGTVDHALFATLNVKHHFVRLWGLSNKVVVLDEVHAYDTYTSGLIEALLRWLKEMHCSVVLMSATLPTIRRRDLFKAWGCTDDLAKLPYPRILLGDQTGVSGEHFSARQMAPISIHGIGESVGEVAEKAVALVRQGGCGAIIVNTVERAQKLYQIVQPQLEPEVPLVLFHARFPADERVVLERQVIQLFGPPDGECGRPVRALLIATQVAEQSLDIDFDFLISDLAPVDLLLQRAGRLHRHERLDRAPYHIKPSLYVAGLLPDRLPDLTTTSWGRIYGEYLCLVTWAILKQEKACHLPADIDRLVQAVYAEQPDLGGISPDTASRIQEVASSEHKAAAEVERLMAKNVAIHAAAEPCNAYVGKPHGAAEDDTWGLRNRTRLGDDSIAAVPLLEDVDGLWRLSQEGASFNRNIPANDELARRLYARQVRVSRRAAVAALGGQARVALFTEHPLLNHLVPLPLRDGKFDAGKVFLRLDPILGLCYDNLSHQVQT